MCTSFLKKFSSLLLVGVFLLPLFSFAAGNFTTGSEVADFVDTRYGSLKLNITTSPTAHGVTITSTNVVGHAWGDVVGWVNFGPFDNNNASVEVSCSSGTATFSGYAWGENAGWVNFGPFVGGTTAQQVQVDSSGNLTGYAWAENAGWLDFAGTETSFTCPTGGGGGGNGCIGPGCIPPPTNAPTCSISASSNQVASPFTPVTLSWNLSGTAPLSFSITNTSVSTSSNGTVTVSPAQTTTYTGTVTNVNGTGTCNRTIVVSSVPQVLGCTDTHAVNYNPLATVDNGRCILDPTATFELEYTNEELVTNASCTYFKSYLKKGDRGIEVAKVQNFLNKYMASGLKVDGVYGVETTEAVKQFQARHTAEIIDPWRPFLTKPSGWWYKTTAGTANIIVGCTQEPVFLDNTQQEYKFESAVKNLFNKLFDLVKSNTETPQ